MVSYFYFYFFTDKKAKYVVISLHEQPKLKKKKYKRPFLMQREKTAHPTLRHSPEKLNLETRLMPKMGTTLCEAPFCLWGLKWQPMQRIPLDKSIQQRDLQLTGIISITWTEPDTVWTEQCGTGSQGWWRRVDSGSFTQRWAIIIFLLPVW